MDIEKLLDKWADNIKQYEEAANEAAESEVNLDSVMAKQIVIAKDHVGSTLAEKTAKGSQDALTAKLRHLKAENKVKAQKSKLNWLEAAYTWERVKYSREYQAAK